MKGKGLLPEFTIASKLKSRVTIERVINKETVGEKTVTKKEQNYADSLAFQSEDKLPGSIVKNTELHFLSFDEMKHLSVCDITSPDLSGIGTVADPRLGVLDKDKVCGTCNMTANNCPGHCGLITFPTMFLNPLVNKYAIYCAQCVCNDCGQLLVRDKNVLRKEGVDALRDLARIRKLASLCESQRCNNEVHKTPFINPEYEPTKIKGERKIICRYPGDKSKSRPFEQPVEKLYNIFKNISKEDLLLMGFENGAHPMNFCMGGLMVIDPSCRPYVVQDGVQKPDYLTSVYIDILKVIKNYDDSLERDKTDKGIVERESMLDDLYDKVSHFMDNGDNKYIKSPDEPIIGVKQRLLRKEGYIRKYAMGKRVNFCFRSVAGPGVNLRFGESGIPSYFRKTLTIPEVVTLYNHKRILSSYNEGEVNFLLMNSSVSGHKRGNRVRIDERTIKIYEPHIGDVAERWLTEKDSGIINRQPTLHASGFLGHRFVFHEDLNIKAHPLITTAYNLDFDGDELNGHVPQTLQSQVEVEGIANVKRNIMSNQSNRPMMGLIFNLPVSANLLSLITYLIPNKDWDDCLRKCLIDGDRLYSLEDRLSLHNVPLYSGRALFSVLLPTDFFYNKRGIKIKNGILIEGVLTKDHVGPSVNSIVHVMHKIYSADIVVRFFTEAQWLLDWFSKWHGVTVGYGDCVISEEKDKTIKDIVKSSTIRALLQIEALTVGKTKAEKEKYEREVLTILKKISGEAAKEGVSTLDITNNLKMLIESKAKGSPANISSIIALLGQQDINGKRPEMRMNGGRRFSPYSDLDDEDVTARGFVAENFLEGLRPLSFLFHSASSREGLVDTAVKTAHVGDLHHRIGKVLEDVHISYNGCVSDKNTIFQFSFGDGSDVSSMISTKSMALGEIINVVDWETIVEKLNNDVETGYLV
jgi:DNA-directed RNA polymerase beta' subunit